MKKKLLNLLNQKKTIIDRMKAADEANDQGAFDTAQAELANIDNEITRVKAIVDAENSVPEPEPTPQTNNGGTYANAANHSKNSNECIRAFCACIRAGARNDRQALAENMDIVTRAVKNEGGMTEGTPADGGLIVPQDIQTMINEQKRALSPLSDLFTVETVTSNTGTRVRDTSPTTGFTKIAEMGEIGKTDKPTFAKVEYNVQKYALIVPVSNDLMADTDQNLLAYLSRWLGKKAVITENSLLLGLLKTLDGAATAITAADAIKNLKTMRNTNLDPAFIAGMSYITNQSGFNFLDTLTDNDGRPLLQPNIAAGTGYMFGNKPIHVISDALLPNADTTPIYMGDFKQFGTLFRRAVMSIKSTDVGGDAWGTDSTEVRAITRLDAQKFDDKAAVAGKITVADEMSAMAASMLTETPADDEGSQGEA